MTIPNLIAGFRLAAAPFLVVLAAADLAIPVLVLFLVLEASDWVDGKLAIALDQRSTLGARLDTVADLAMYGAFLLALAILEGDLLLAEWRWLAPAVATYALSWALSLLKFGALPSYHTWSAKFSALLATVAAVTLLAFGDSLALRIAAAGVTLANVEAVLVTLKLDAPRADVRSILTLR